MASARDALDRFFNHRDRPKLFGVSGSATENREALSSIVVEDSKAKLTDSTNIFIPSTTSPLSNIAPSDRSTASSTSLGTSILSRKDTSSTVSSVSETEQQALDQQLGIMTLHHSDIVYSCTFNIIGCPVQFRPSEFADWFSHNLSHFRSHPLPTNTRCIFCPVKFLNDDPEICWRQRMVHIADHLDEGLTIEDHARPDFALINHLYTQGIIDTTRYEALAKGSERPRLDGFRPHNHIPDSIERKDEERKYRESKVPIKDPRRRGQHRSRR